MNLHTFKRGIHPPDGKAYTNTKAIEIIMPKEGASMVFPLSQHIGAPATAIVAKGDRVLLGQKIAEAGSFVSSPIHSSVSGTVTDIKPMLAPSGAMIPSIIIENNGLYEEDPSLGKDTDWQSFSKEKILEKAFFETSTGHLVIIAICSVLVILVVIVPLIRFIKRKSMYGSIDKF